MGKKEDKKNRRKTGERAGRLGIFALSFLLLAGGGRFFDEVKASEGNGVRSPEETEVEILTEDKDEESGSEKSDREKKPKKKKKRFVKRMETLVIGDSIGYGMSLIGHPTGVDDADKVYWVTEGGAGIGLISDTLRISLGHSMPNAVNNTLTGTKQINLVDEIRKKKIKNVVILLGMNWIGAKSAYQSSVRMQAIREKTGSNVFYFATLPVVDRKAAKYGYRLRNEDVKEYNRMVKDGIKNTGVVFVDTYGAVKKIKGYENATGDGLHYGRSVYNEAFKYLLKIIEKKNREDFEKIEKWRRKGKLEVPFEEKGENLKINNGKES